MSPRGPARGDAGRVGPFVLGANLLELRDLSDGAFGSTHEAFGPVGERVVAKGGRRTGGSASNTRAEALDPMDGHRPDLAFARDPDVEGWRHATLPVTVVDDVLLREAAVLERGGGRLLPRLHGVFPYETPPWMQTESDGRPFLVMELVAGGRPSTTDDVGRVLAALAESVRSGDLDYHGDLKPEHVFVGDRIRLVDPAPRFPDDRTRAFTPEYNPHELTGPPADVFAIGVLLYAVVARVEPFIEPRRQGLGAATLEPPPPVARGRAGVPQRLATAVDELLVSDPGDLPDWAHDHATALDRIFGGLER